MNNWKTQGQVLWESASQKCQSGVNVVRRGVSTSAERLHETLPRAAELIHSAWHEVGVVGRSVSERSGAAYRRAKPTIESCAKTLLKQVVISLLIVAGYILFLIPCRILTSLMGGPPQNLFIVTAVLYLVFVWLPVYILAPELVTRAFAEGHFKEDSNLPLRLMIDQLDTRNVGMKEVLLKERNANMCMTIGIVLILLAVSGCSTVTIFGSVLLVPFFYRHCRHPATEGTSPTDANNEMPVPSPEEMNPPEYESLTPPPHLYTTPPAYEDILPCGEDTQTLLSNSPAVFAGVPLCSVHQPSIRPTDSNRSTHSQQTAPNVLESVRSQSLETL